MNSPQDTYKMEFCQYVFFCDVRVHSLFSIRLIGEGITSAGVHAFSAILKLTTGLEVLEYALLTNVQLSSIP